MNQLNKDLKTNVLNGRLFQYLPLIKRFKDRTIGKNEFFILNGVTFDFDISDKAILLSTPLDGVKLEITKESYINFMKQIEEIRNEAK